MLRRIQPRLGERRDDVREEPGVDVAHVETDGRRAGPLEQRRDRPRDLVARGELVDEAVAVGVEQRRALAADGLRHEEALATRDAPTPRWGGTGGTRDPRARRRRRARAPCRSRASPAGSSCATTAPPRRRSRRSSRAPGSRGRPRAGCPRSGRRGSRRSSRARPRARRSRAVLDDERRELAHDPPAGRAAAGVHDAPHRMAALEAEREHAAAVGVEAHAEALEVGDAGGRLVDEHLGGGAANGVAAGGLGVGEVALGGVLDGERGGDAALRPVARRLRERGGRHERDGGVRRGGGQRRVEAGGAGPDDRHVGGEQRFVGHGAQYGIRDAGPGPVAPSLLARARHRPAPGVAATDRGDRARAERARLARVGRAAVRSRRRASAIEAVHPARHVERIEALSARGGGMIDMDTIVSEGSFVAALHAAGGAVELVEALLGAERCGRGRDAAPAARPPRDRDARDGLLPLQQRRDRRAARGRRVRRAARADPRLGRPSRQRHERHLRRARRRPVLLDPPVAAVSGDGPASDVGTRRGGGVHGQPAGAGRLAATTCSCRSSSTSCGRWRAPSSPTSCSSRPATTRTPTTRWPDAS